MQPHRVWESQQLMNVSRTNAAGVSVRYKYMSTFVSIKLWGLLELLQQACNSKMSEIPQLHPAACLYPLVFSAFANAYNPDTWKKERKYLFLYGVHL